MRFLRLFRSDLDFAMPANGRFRRMLAIVTNPSIRAVLLVRMAQCAPGALFWIFRSLLITLHSIDIGKGCRIGRRLMLPHPVGVVIGGGVVIGDECRIFQNVTLGQAKGVYPILENRVIVYPNSVIVGEVVVPAGGRVRACSFIAPSASSERHCDE